MNGLSEDQFKKVLKTQCIGLTGGVATGKSTVAQILRDLGKTVIDADQLARDVVKPGSNALSELIQHFGRNIVTKDGQLDRAKLRTLVMDDPDQRKTLEGIIHPAIHRSLKKIVEDLNLHQTKKSFFYEAALIFETGRDQLFRELWVTSCPEDIQLSRLCDRSKLSKSEALKFIAAQMPQTEKTRKASLVLDTNCSLDELRQQVEDCVKAKAP